MCGCGTWEWCNGGCSCGCDHDTSRGMRRQGESFAEQHRLYREAGGNSFQTGYAAGLDAARDAVAALPWTSETWQAHGERAAVLAAIDALREKP